MQVMHINIEDMREIEHTVYKFIWNGPDKIKRDVMKSINNTRGLKAPDIFS